MPSNFTTSLSGQNKAISANTANKASSVAKMAGSVTLQAPNLTRVQIYGVPSVLDGSSNDGITDVIVAGTGNVGNSIGYAIGSAIGTVDVVRKRVELTVSDANRLYKDPLHDKTVDREPVFTASGYFHNIHGVVMSSGGGAAVSSIASSTGVYSINSTSTAASGVDQSILGGNYGNPYYFRNAIQNKEIDIPKRTQL